MFLCQKKYVVEVLEHVSMSNCHSFRTPVDTESKLRDDGTPISDPTLFRSLTGALWYLTFTRPDLAYAVQHICLFMHDPREPHLVVLKRILSYVCGTLDYALQLYSSSTSSYSLTHDHKKCRLRKCSYSIFPLLKEFKDVFVVPTSLPPNITHDHTIPFKEGTQPVNIRPYPYKHPPTQKDATRVMVKKLLDTRVIRYSQS
ncbi:ribonuclease H-like domain-containing protein [Tanacetum coccineum]